MKRLPRLCRESFSLLLTLALGLAASGAVTPTEWQHRQTVSVTAAGLTKIVVPAATFDGAQTGLADLRLLDTAGREVPYLLDRNFLAAPERPSWFAPETFRAAPRDDTLQLTLETGTREKLEAVELATSAAFFLKAAHVEISTDGQTWESLGPAAPVFRQFGAEQLRLSLQGRAAAFVRVTLDDFRSRALTFTGARLLAASAKAAAPVRAPVGARITQREEFAGETVLTITLDGRHVPLAGLTLEVTDALFMRRATVAVREVTDGTSAERTLASGTIYRVALDGAPARTQLELPFDFVPPARELLLHIYNGDSPPLALTGVQASQQPVHVLFLAPAAGDYTLLSGNTQAAAPRYDLAGFGAELRASNATLAALGAITPTPDYRPRESIGATPLPEVAFTGAPLDTSKWTERRQIVLTRPGVQELELDPAALAHTRADFGDLRVMLGENQVPYVLEQTGLARSLALEPTLVPDKKRPSLSVWQLTLPEAGLPLRRLVLSSSSPLFQRELRIFEKIAEQNRGTLEVTLATGAWSRMPEPGLPVTRSFEFTQPVRSNVLWIETDNGDNPGIALDSVQVTYPVVRVIFVGAQKTSAPTAVEAERFSLVYGNPAASPPRYDLGLVGAQLLLSNRVPAQLQSQGKNPAARETKFAGLNTGYLFWGALGLVVIALLIVVARLLPKPPAA